MMTGYYTTRAEGLVRDFDRACAWYKPGLIQGFGLDRASDTLQEARGEYVRLIPQIPYIGGPKVHMTSDLLESVQVLAFLRGLRTQGATLRESGAIVFGAVRERLSRYPRLALKLGELRAFSGPFRSYLKRQAAGSRAREYPAGFVFEFLAGDGREFDWGLDITECGILKFFEAQGEADFMPVVCPIDYVLSEWLGYGLARTKTLAEGAECCNPRLKRGCRTQWRLPEVLGDMRVPQAGDLSVG
jgi:hypothetical protein